MSFVGHEGWLLGYVIGLVVVLVVVALVVPILLLAHRIGGQAEHRAAAGTQHHNRICHCDCRWS